MSSITYNKILEFYSMTITIADIFTFVIFGHVYQRSKRKRLQENRPVHALECIKGNQGKLKRNSKACVEVQNDEENS